ncbi:MAG: DUF1593 domain-containing protein [Balneolaceae bacterium]|nr:DUF1593 domain-containing protein [Balneolaceae bacterium]
MRQLPIILLAVLLPVTLYATSPADSLKPRVIHLTDLGADPDDRQSMVRFLVQSNEFDVEGLVVQTGCWKKSQSNTAMLDEIVDAYGEVLPNLRVHSPAFPSLEYLHSVSVLGQTGYGMAAVGDGKDSKGSELIISAVDEDDPRPVWVTFWGGGNTLAQALWKVRETRSDAEFQEFISKIRVYDVLGQDNAGTWIAKNFPEILYIRATGVYGWQPSDEWLATHIQSHGPLGEKYPDRKYATEGDTPAFLHVLPNGLNNPDKQWHGGWGGRFEREKKAGIRGMSCMEGEDAEYDPYYMYGNTDAGAEAISRWKPAYDNDFQARMDWTVTSNYSEANHHPVAVVNGDETKQILQITADAGSTVQLNAAGSDDPDGDALSYNWYFYDEPSTYDGTVSVQNSSSTSAEVSIPSDASGKNIHVILEVTDDGEPNLTTYRRIIITAEE